MRLQPQFLVDKMTGKVDGVTFAVVKGSSAGDIMTVKRFTPPYNPNTPDQQLTRNIFSKSIVFFNTASDTTIGVTSFVRADYLSEILDIVRASNYRGVPTVGSYAGRQLWIGGCVNQRPSIPLIEAGVLPQTAADEPELIALLAEIDLVLAFMSTMVQPTRLGYLV